MKILFLVWAAATQPEPQCISLNYDALSQFANASRFPSSLRLGLGGWDSWRAIQDTAGKWGTPLAWNTYRLRGDSIAVWLANGNEEVRIVGRIAGHDLDARVEVRTDVPGREVAHAVGRMAKCSGW